MSSASGYVYTPFFIFLLVVLRNGSQEVHGYKGRQGRIRFGSGPKLHVPIAEGE